MTNDDPFKKLESRLPGGDNHPAPTYKMAFLDAAPELILQKIQGLIDNRNLKEEISYKNGFFRFVFLSDPTVIFQDDLNARSSAIFCGELRKILQPLGYQLITVQKVKEQL